MIYSGIACALMAIFCAWVTFNVAVIPGALLVAGCCASGALFWGALAAVLSFAGIEAQRDADAAARRAALLARLHGCQ